jgi:uncharacterized membrane protein
MFSRGEAIRFGWDSAVRHLKFFVVALILAGLAQGVPNSLQASTREWAPLLSLQFGLASLVIGQVVAIGLTRISLRVCDGQQPEYSDLYNGLPLFFKYLLASILYGLIVAGGLVLLIVPGIMWAVRFGLFGFAVVDQKAGPVEALRRSSALTQGARWNLFVFGLMLFGIVVLGALAFVVGLFLAVPTALVAAAYVYRRLLAQASGVAASGPAPGIAPAG